MIESGPFPLPGSTSQVLQEGLAGLLEPHGPLVADLIAEDGSVSTTVPVEVKRTGTGLELLVPFPLLPVVYLVKNVLVKHDEPILLLKDIDILVTAVSPDYTLSVPVTL